MEIEAVLNDTAVQKKLFSYGQGVHSVSREKLRNGKHGWVVSLDKCALEVEVEYKSTAVAPRLPGGHRVERQIHMHDCR